jgi:hypothetical protein
MGRGVQVQSLKKIKELILFHLRNTLKLFGVQVIHLGYNDYKGD